MRFSTRVRHGAKHLDSLMPGWARKIRLRDLDLKHGEYAGKGDCGCILAQLDAWEDDSGRHTGDYGRGARSILGVPSYTDPVIKAEGFSLNMEETANPGMADTNWAELTELWKDEIRSRR